MKILLISTSTFQSPHPVYPIGLDYVVQALSDRHQVKILDMNIIDGLEDIDNRLIEFDPDIVGLSIRNIDNTDLKQPMGFVEDCRRLAAHIRNRCDAEIVLGGSGFSIFPSELMELVGADYGVIGEGEKLADLLDCLEKGRDSTGLDGIVTGFSQKSFPGHFQQSFRRKVLTNSPHLKFYAQRGGIFNLQTKRGCAFRCIYCTYPLLEGRKLRLSDPLEVAENARSLQDAGARFIFITDSVFNSHWDYSMDVARAFVEKRVSIPWGAFFMPQKPPADYYRILADAGLSHVEFGTESLSRKVLETYRKPFDLSDAFIAHRSAVDAGIHVAHYFLPGGPGETVETLNSSLRNIDKLDKAVLFFFPGIRIYPHTELFRIAIREGQIKETDNLLQPIFYRSKSIDGQELIETIEQFARGRSNWIIGAGGDKMSKILSKMYKLGYHGPLWERLIP